MAGSLSSTSMTRSTHDRGTRDRIIWKYLEKRGSSFKGRSSGDCDFALPPPATDFPSSDPAVTAIVVPPCDLDIAVVFIPGYVRDLPFRPSTAAAADVPEGETLLRPMCRRVRISSWLSLLRPASVSPPSSPVAVPARMARRRFIRATAAAAAAVEVRVPVVASGGCVVPSPSTPTPGSSSLRTTGFNSPPVPPISPALAVMAASSALTEANVSAAAGTTFLPRCSSSSPPVAKRPPREPSSVSDPGGEPPPVGPTSTTTPSFQSTLPNSSTLPPGGTCALRDLSGSRSRTRSSFPSTSRTRLTQERGTLALSILKYLL